MKKIRLRHIMFIPLFGAQIEKDLIINLAAIVIFLGIYVWHVKHDHKHNEELIKEIKELRKDVNGRLRKKRGRKRLFIS